MGLLSRPTQPNTRSLTAAAKSITPSESGKSFRGGQEWQKAAWDYYDQVGELHYAVSFYASCMRRLKLRIMLRDRQGSIVSAWDDKGVAQHPQADEAQAALRGLIPSIGGHGELLASSTANLVVAGECYLVGQEKENGAVAWEILSVEELVEESRTFKYVADDGSKVNLNAIEDPIRIWKSHARRAGRADSSTRAVLEVLEELILLTRGVRATTVSRLAGAGILFIPEEMQLPKPADDESDADQFVEDLIAAMVTPITDKGSAAAVVPHVVRVPGAQIEKVLHLDFTKAFDAFPAVELRKEAVQRLAQGIDLPVEIVTGQGGTNHWSAWQIDESTFKAHIEPLAEIIVDGFTDWLENRLLERTVQNGLEVIVHYDSNELVSHPNESADANDAFDRFTISAARYRAAKGFADGDAPDEAEIVERLTIAAATRTGQGAVVEGPPVQDEAVTAAIDVSVHRAIEKVGAQLRSKLNGQGHRAMLDGVANAAAAMYLGPAKVKETLGDDVFGTEFLALGKWAERSGLVPSEIMDRARSLAARRLFDSKAS